MGRFHGGKGCEGILEACEAGRVPGRYPTDQWQDPGRLGLVEEMGGVWHHLFESGAAL